MSQRVLVAALLGATLSPGSAQAFKLGSTRSSGKPGDSTCTYCHTAGAATPLVSFEEGLTAVRYGSSAIEYVFKSAGGPAATPPVLTPSRVGFNVSASAGTLDLVGDADGARKENGELTHALPKEVTGNSAQWRFLWTPPLQTGTHHLYGAGCSANGDDTSSGDGSANQSMAIQVYCPDDDSDGMTVACDVAGPVDCDDNDAARYPGKAEICDAKDNDCDNAVDGFDGSCYPCTGAGCQSTAGVGACRAGLRTCTAGGWNACQGHVLPQSSDGDCNGVDDDCDGQVDEESAVACCAPDDTRDCYPCTGSGCQAQAGKGTCRAGAQTCDGTGTWGACEGHVLPKPIDRCGGGDEDCDETVDEDMHADGTACCIDGDTRSRYSGPPNSEFVGLCRGRRERCDAGLWKEQSPEVLPQEESPGAGTCGDGRDNDCDGQMDGADDNCPECAPNTSESCYGGPDNTLGIGVCAAGSRQCLEDGRWSACLGAVKPHAEEICRNALDDDCDGRADEDCGRVSAQADEGCAAASAFAFSAPLILVAAIFRGMRRAAVRGTR